MIGWNVKLHGAAWKQAAAIGRKAKGGATREALKKAVLQEALYIHGLMVQGMLSGAPAGQAFARHSPLTMAIASVRGTSGTKILIQSGTLLGSIKVTPIAGGAFVGVKRGSGGGYQLATLHEYGKSWMMTDGQRKFIGAMLRMSGISADADRGGGAGGGGGRITIPARPFIGPILAAHCKPEQVKKRINDRLAPLLRQVFRG